ncbi:MAG: hypothetical protein NVS2B11_14470 [Acetobacteraceae bacterium]
MSVDTGALGRTLEAYLARAGVPLAFHDRATQETHAFPVSSARDPAGLLPVFLVAGEAVWREATGKGFALDIRQDAGALLGRRLHAVGSGTFSTVMLSVIEASEQVSGPQSLLVNDLRGQWAASLTRAASPAMAQSPPRTSPGASP